jgi:hypothetical protein
MTLATAFFVSKLCIILVVVLLGIAAYLKFNQKYNPTSAVGGQSAFAKIADADTKQKEAEGKIVAVKAAANATQAAAGELKKAAVEAHGELDKAHKELDHVHELLG